MNEKEWLASNNPSLMLHALLNVGLTRKEEKDGVDWFVKRTLQRKLELFRETCQAMGYCALWGMDADHMARCANDQGAIPNYAQNGLAISERKRIPGRVANLLRCIFGNPFRPRPQVRAFGGLMKVAWLRPDAIALAQSIYDSKDFNATDMGVLGDMLEDAGCADEQLLEHLRWHHYEHASDCWAINLILGKE